MRCMILRALRAEARAWWAHKDLRAAGRHKEARARENASIKSNVRVLRAALATEGAHVSQGRGGTTIHYARGCTLKSYAPVNQFAAARIAICLGVPFIDTRSVAHPRRLIGLPLVAVGEPQDPEPWGAFSRAPLDVYARRAAELGAQITNLDMHSVH